MGPSQNPNTLYKEHGSLTRIITSYGRLLMAAMGQADSLPFYIHLTHLIQETATIQPFPLIVAVSVIIGAPHERRLQNTGDPEHRGQFPVLVCQQESA